MRKYAWILAAGALAAVVFAQSSGAQVLQGFVSALQGAQSLKVVLSVTPDGGAPESFSIALGKPNLARIDTANQLVVADGKTIAVLDKKSNQYYRDAQTSGSLAGLLQGEGLALWAPFFDAKALANVSSRALGTKNRKGILLQVIDATFDGGKRKVTYYFDGANIARQAEVGYHDTGDKRTIVDTKSVELGAAVAPGDFAFTPPAGSKELTEEERMSDKWYEDLNAALADAKKTKRLVLIDFSAVW